MQYGLTSQSHAKALAYDVVEGLGGGNSVYCLLVETACAETLLGSYPDSHPDKWGVGVCQHDQINLIDIKRFLKKADDDLIHQRWGYLIKNIKLAHLANDPLLSFICCRLSYKRIPEAVPADLYGRALYWKEYYNTNAGKGTPEHYLKNVAECLGEEWQ